MFFSAENADNCFGDSCYRFSLSGSSWNENRDTCRGFGGDLVSMETEEEWQYINSQIQQLNITGQAEWHIGLMKDDQGVWNWVNGSPLTISKWQTTDGQPSGDGDVVVMAKNYPPGTRGHFNDLTNRSRRAFICELPRGKMMKKKKRTVETLSVDWL